MDDKIKSIGDALVAKHGKGRIAFVPISGGGAFFRQPTPEEYDDFLAATEAGADKRAAHRAYVRACFCTALIADAEVSSFDAVIEHAGPAFASGAAGKAVNALAGAGERAPTRFF